MFYILKLGAKCDQVLRLYQEQFLTSYSCYIVFAPSHTETAEGLSFSVDTEMWFGFQSFIGKYAQIVVFIFIPSSSLWLAHAYFQLHPSITI